MHNSQYKPIIDALVACAAECEHCATACLQEEDVKMMIRCIQLDRDCSALCRTTADALARNSENAQVFLDACAAICAACGEECEKHAQHMDHCRACAEACRRCEEACRSLSGKIY